MRLPQSWGLGQAEVHSSLFITLSLLAGVLLSISELRLGYAELRMVAISMPIVWILSLAIRIAAQQLAVGGFAKDSGTTVGPSGNLQTDYEYWPSRTIFAYSISGQLASLGLMALSLVILAAMTSSSAKDIVFAELLDLRGGWDSRAWASQILWVNTFLFALHLLPTVPFDMRATVFAGFGMRSRNSQEPYVFRSIASLDSHLSAMLFGGGITAAVFGLMMGREAVGWYAAVAAAVYMFVASQWEAARADELEQQYMPTPTRIRHSGSAPKLQPHVQFEAPAEEVDPIDALAAQAEDSSDELLTGLLADDLEGSPPDIDEILRKLHREGASSLTLEEQQALLSASREIQDRRGQAT